MISPKISLFFLFLFLAFDSLFAQDSVRLSFPDFVTRAKEQSAIARVSQSDVELARNRINEAKALKWFPRIQIQTNHGLVPGIKTDSSKSRAFLDPNLSNDFSSLSIFTRVEFSAVQPLFVWGAINNAIRAAKMGAEAAKDQAAAKDSGFEQRLFEVYQSRLLAEELKRLLDQATDQFNKAEKQLEKMQEDGQDIDDSDVFKFKVARYQFNSKSEEVDASLEFINNIWAELLDAETGIVYLPRTPYLPMWQSPVEDVNQFVEHAAARRPELKALDHAIKAAQYGYSANKAQRLPGVFLGLGAEFVSSPRPADTQPMVGDRFTYANFIYSFGLRQNLNFGKLNFEVDKSYLQIRKAKVLREAATEAIRMEVQEKYKNWVVKRGQLNQEEGALQTSKEWLRMEQLDYDLGFGEIKDLVDALKTNLELEASYLQKVFELNLSTSELYVAGGFNVVEEYNPTDL